MAIAEHQHRIADPVETEGKISESESPTERRGAGARIVRPVQLPDEYRHRDEEYRNKSSGRQGQSRGAAADKSAKISPPAGQIPEIGTAAIDRSINRQGLKTLEYYTRELVGFAAHPHQ